MSIQTLTKRKPLHVYLSPTERRQAEAEAVRLGAGNLSGLFRALLAQSVLGAPTTTQR